MAVGPDYLKTMQIALHRGRFINASDAADDNHLSVAINEAAARRFWPGREALGAYAHFSRTDGPRVRVAGVIADVKNDGLGAETRPEIYVTGLGVRVNPVHFL